VTDLTLADLKVKGESVEPATILIILGILEKIAAGAGAGAILAFAGRSPQAMLWLKRYVLGSNILIVGHARAGKTSFYNYLRHGQLAETLPTQRTDTVETTRSYSIKLGDKVVDISTSLDIPGDLPIGDQIEVIQRKQPHAILVFLSPLSRENLKTEVEWLPAELWLRIFIQQFRILLERDPQLAKKLACLRIVLNKSDLVAQQELTAKCDQLHSILSKELGQAFDTVLAPIFPCTLMKDKGGELAANTVTLELISCLKKRKKLFPLPPNLW
jgi:GTPase SAR1 family protein